MEKIKFSDLDVHAFIGYLNDADIDLPTVIDFSEDKISCRAHPQTKSIVKSTTAPTADIMVFDQLPKNFNIIKFPLHRIKKLESAMNVFRSASVEKISGVFTYEVDNNEMVVLYGEFVGGGIKIRVKRTETFLVPYMEEEIWNRLSVIDDYQMKLEMTSDFVTKLSKLIGLKIGEDDNNEKNKSKTESFIMEIKDKKISFKSRTTNQWSINYRDEDGNCDVNMDDITFVVPQVVVAKMKGEINTIYMTKKGNQWVMVTKRDEGNIMLNAVQESNGDI